MADYSHVLDRIAAGSSKLYSLPVVAVKVLELTKNPRADARELKECIENDPALVAKVLRVVNSSLFGLSREVSDLNQAVALLGIEPLKLLVLGFSLPDSLFRGVAADVLSHYWRHTLSRAVAARELSERFWSKSGDDAFIAGLLQDIGLLVMVQELGEPYLNFATRVYEEQGDLVALERATLGFDHVELTARLLNDWHMPKSLVDAVGADREGELSADAPLIQILHLAELIAMAIADGRTVAMAQLLAAADAYGMISQSQLETLFVQLQEKVQQLADALSLDLSQEFDYRQLLIDAHAQLAEVAAGVAGELVGQDAVGENQPPKVEKTGGEPLRSDEANALIASLAKLPPLGATPVSAESMPVGTAVADPPRTAPEPPESPPASQGADPELLWRLTAGVATCRRDRCPLSLLLVELDGYAKLVFHTGAASAERLFRRVVEVCESLGRPGSLCVEYGEAQLGLVLVDCDRQEAVRAGRQLLHAIESLSSGDDAHPVSVSIGAASLAVPPPNFPPADLVTAARRCQNGVRGSGGGGLKSIEIY